MPGQYRNSIAELNPIPGEAYENIFKMYKTGDYYFYNILNTITFPTQINKDSYDKYIVQGDMLWTTLSYDVYGTINLWWLIALINGIDDPTQIAKAGTELKVLKTGLVGQLLQSIQTQLVE